MSKKRKKKKKADGGVERSPELTKPGGPVVPSGAPDPATQPPTSEASPPRVDGRQFRPRTGKSSRTDEYVQSCLYLKTETKYAAMRQLQDERSGEDFSDLMQRLLEQWLATRSRLRFRASE